MIKRLPGYRLDLASDRLSGICPARLDSDGRGCRGSRRDAMRSLPCCNERERKEEEPDPSAAARHDERYVQPRAEHTDRPRLLRFDGSDPMWHRSDTIGNCR